METINSLYRSCELSGGQERECNGKDEEEDDETNVLPQSDDASRQECAQNRSPEYTEQPGTHRKKKVTIVQVIRKMPRPLLSSFGSVYAARIPLPGIKMVAYDIQNAPYEEKAVDKTRQYSVRTSRLVCRTRMPRHHGPRERERR